MAIVDKVINRDGPGGIVGASIRLVIGILQFILAITVAGLYGVDLHHGSQKGAPIDGKWVFAEVVAGLAAATVLIRGILYCIPSEKVWPWDWVIFILWTALFGLFGKIYIPDHPTPEQPGQQRMKHAVWVDLVNMLLWLIMALWNTFEFMRRKSRRTLHTGRGKV